MASGTDQKRRSAPFLALLLGLLGLLSWMLAWLNPNHYPPWVVFENEAGAFVALLLVSLALTLTVSKTSSGQRMQVPGAMTLCLLVPIVVIVAQYFAGLTSLQQGYMGALYLSALGLSVVVGCQAHLLVAEQRAEWEARACQLILLTTLFSAGVVLLQYAGIEHWFPVLAAPHGTHRPFGNLGQPNNQATFLVMGLACLDILRRRQKISPWAAALVLCVLIPAISATGSRAGLLGASCVALYLGLLGAQKERTFTLAWFVALVVLFLLMPSVNNWIGTQDARGVAELVAGSHRIQIYRQLGQALMEHPWVGYGLGRTGYAQSQMALAGDVGEPISNAHNLPLELLLWFGIPIGLLIIVIAMAWLLYSWYNSPAPHRLLYGTLIPFLAHAMVELPYAYSFFLLTFGFIVGYVSAAAALPMAFNWSKNHSLGLSLIVLIGGGLVTYDYIHCVEEFVIVRYEHRKLGNVPIGHQVYRPLILKDLEGQIEAIRTPIGKDISPNGLDNLTAQALVHHMSLAHIKLISHHLLTQEMQAAENELRRFRNLYRAHGEALRWAGETLRNDFCAEADEDAKSSSQCTLIRQYIP